MKQIEVIKTVDELRSILKGYRLQGKTIGYLCTTGNLHDAHAKLADIAKEHSDIVVVSNIPDLTDGFIWEEHVFPNKSTENDARVLSSSGADILFAPSRFHIYPNGWNGHTSVDVPKVTGILCDVDRRPDYFKGVATAVIKLFNIVQPDVSVWGEKDYQQFAVIRKMVEDLSMPIKLISVPSIRYDDGLAYSSRNEKLSKSEIGVAHHLYDVMVTIRNRILSGIEPQEAVLGAKEYLAKFGIRYHYIEVREAATLALANKDSTDAIIFASAFLGPERLVDTLRV